MKISTKYAAFFIRDKHLQICNVKTKFRRWESVGLKQYDATQCPSNVVMLQRLVYCTSINSVKHLYKEHLVKKCHHFDHRIIELAVPLFL